MTRLWIVLSVALSSLAFTYPQPPTQSAVEFRALMQNETILDLMKEAGPISELASAYDEGRQVDYVIEARHCSMGVKRTYLNDGEGILSFKLNKVWQKCSKHKSQGYAETASQLARILSAGLDSQIFQPGSGEISYIGHLDERVQPDAYQLVMENRCYHLAAISKSGRVKLGKLRCD